VLDYMLEKQIGLDFASTYIKVADYAENKVKDLRKAERTLRKGVTHLASSEQLDKELAKVERAYLSFEKRVYSEHTSQVCQVLRRHRARREKYVAEKQSRPFEEYTSIQKEN